MEQAHMRTTGATNGARSPVRMQRSNGATTDGSLSFRQRVLRVPRREGVGRVSCVQFERCGRDSGGQGDGGGQRASEAAARAAQKPSSSPHVPDDVRLPLSPCARWLPHVLCTPHSLGSEWLPAYPGFPPHQPRVTRPPVLHSFLFVSTEWWCHERHQWLLLWSCIAASQVRERPRYVP